MKFKTTTSKIRYIYTIKLINLTLDSMLNHPVKKNLKKKKLNQDEKKDGLQITKPKKAQKMTRKYEKKTSLWDPCPLRNDCTNSVACVENISGDK